MTFRTSSMATILLVFAAGEASAQSSMIDLSKPMSGKSHYVFNADGTPVELGIRIVPKPRKEAAPANAAAAIPASLPAAAQGTTPAAAPAASSQPSSGDARRGIVLGIVGSSSPAPKAQDQPKRESRGSSLGRIRLRRR